MKPLAMLPRLTTLDFPDDIKLNYDRSGYDSGWITGDIMKFWIENQFINEVLQTRYMTQCDDPALVLLDSHSSRSLINREYMWNQYKIFFFFLPPHTSHLIQPLDRSGNGMLKRLLTDNFHGKINKTTNERELMS
jgi:hypothetical protein